MDDSGEPTHEYRGFVDDELARFIDAQVASGRYASSIDVVQEALRLMERLDRMEIETPQRLQNAWREGIDNSDAGKIDFGELKTGGAPASRHQIMKQWTKFGIRVGRARSGSVRDSGVDCAPQSGGCRSGV
jgi:antitoxin ParD1/3/4